MSLRQTLASLLLAALASPLAQAASYDVLDLPALKSDLAPHSMIYSIEKNDGRLFATGHRGHILIIRLLKIIK